VESVAPVAPVAELSSLPVRAAVGAMVVLTTSLVSSKLLLDALVELRWPIAVYVAVLAVVGYGPSLAWCRFASHRWGTGRLGADIGLVARWSDLGWGPVVWLAAVAAQVAAALVVVTLGVPVASNTEAIGDAAVDRTYIVSIVVAAVIAAPIVEEMVFRGVVLRGLLSRVRLVPAVVVQALLFGLAHVDPVRGAGNVGLVIVLSSVGVALGGAAVLLRRLGPSIVGHALFNGAVLLVVLSGLADRVGAASALDERGVVDQADVTQTGSDGDAVPVGEGVLVESVDGLQRPGVEDGHVVDPGERFRVEDRAGGSDHGTDGGRRIA
jgi:membrane protease YdiL (CAAX protease family)